MAISSPKTIGLLAGTFDPVHLGHVGLAKSALHDGLLDEIWFVLDPKVLNVPSERKNAVASFDDRSNMLEIGLARERGMSVYRGPFSGDPHTPRMFSQLISQFSGVNFVFVLGADTFARVAAWDNIEPVVHTTTFMIGSRAELPSTMQEGVKQQLGPAGVDLKVKWFDFDGFRDYSSTEIRSKLIRAESPVGLDSGVHEYIKQHRLYL